MKPAIFDCDDVNLLIANSIVSPCDEGTGRYMKLKILLAAFFYQDQFELMHVGECKPLSHMQLCEICYNERKLFRLVTGYT